MMTFACLPFRRNRNQVAFAVLLWVVSASVARAETKVTVQRAPNGGIQPGASVLCAKDDVKDYLTEGLRHGATI